MEFVHEAPLNFLEAHLLFMQKFKHSKELVQSIPSSFKVTAKVWLKIVNSANDNRMKGHFIISRSSTDLFISKFLYFEINPGWGPMRPSSVL